jgi:hypothetical protein
MTKKKDPVDLKKNVEELLKKGSIELESPEEPKSPKEQKKKVSAGERKLKTSALVQPVRRVVVNSFGNI